MSVKRILIVEDEAITSEVIAEELITLGYEVVGQATSASDAIAQATQTRPDLVLMDIKLDDDEPDGIDAAAQIRAQFNVPIIYLTAHSDEATLNRAKVTEPYGYLLKPFNEQSLQAAIETALYKHDAEQKIAEENAFLSTLLRSIGDAVVAADRSGNVTYMNPAAEQLTGWDLTAALGKDSSEVVQIVDQATNKPIPSLVLEVLRSGRVLYLDESMALIAKSGRRVNISDSASPIWDTEAASTVVGAVLVLSDISDRRRLGELEQEVQRSQRAEAETRQLLEAERELSDVRNRLISALSYEYRTPLTIIATSSELLRSQGNDLTREKREGYFANIRQAVRLLDRLVDSILLYGRADAGQLSFQPAPLEVADFCQQLIDNQQTAAEDDPAERSSRQRHRLEYINRNTVDTAVLDVELLWHILTNLLSNAVKYSPEDTTITLTSLCSTTQAVFQVRDQGIGISAQSMDQIFDPFFRAPEITRIPGNGMGLSIVKKCVDLHNGQIVVESTVGVGSTFTVTLPVSAAPAS